LAKSASKNQVFRRLGIQADRDHKLMLDEAAAGRERLSYNPENLADSLRANPNIQPPYKWDQLSETAKHKELLHIYRTASPRARMFFDKGSYTTTVEEENWAVAWYLWHSFRYRDNREHGQ
ncbi:hypothetical protein M011DRAFT_378461, partial [Sporormia fimetaria CBS 119925]